MFSKNRTWHLSYNIRHGKCYRRDFAQKIQCRLLPSRGCTRVCALLHDGKTLPTCSSYLCREAFELYLLKQLSICLAQEAYTVSKSVKATPAYKAAASLLTTYTSQKDEGYLDLGWNFSIQLKWTSWQVNFSWLFLEFWMYTSNYCS